MNTTDQIIPPNELNLLQYAGGAYKRTAVRHRSAAATVLVLKAEDPEVVLAQATFRTQQAAAVWAEAVTHQPVRRIVVILTSTGETAAVTSPDDRLTRKAANTAEWIWRGSKPVPRKSLQRPPVQTELWP
jgi:hypothetical protein